MFVSMEENVNSLVSNKELDPVFARLGVEVYSYEHVQKIREKNLECKKNGKPLVALVPQEGFQEKALTIDADIKIEGGKRGLGKVLSNDSDIITPFGIRKNGNLKVGDIISNPVTGGMEKVIAIYEHPKHDFYEIIFDDGATVECGLEHLWVVRQTGYTHKSRYINNTGLESEYRVWTFEMVKRWLDEQANGKCKGKKLVIPLTEPVKFSRAGNAMRKGNIDPYIVGAMIGDGCLAHSVVDHGYALFTTADKEMVDTFKNHGYDMSHVRKDGITYEIREKDFIDAFKICKLTGCKSENKFIPMPYKFGTVEDRFALIQGLMDTDGFISKDSGICQFTTVSEQLAKDFQFVIRSLGAAAKLSIDTNTGYKDKDGNFIKCKDAYTITFRMRNTERCFRLKRKLERCRPYNGGISIPSRRIVGYRHIGIKDGRCITVDSTNSLYMTNDFIVTHNTFLGLFEALPYIFNPDVNMYGFRKYEDDIKRGIWKSSKQVYRDFGTSADTSFTWQFLDGMGATMTMEHLQDPKKIKDRFRGVEMAYILIEELAEHTRDSLDVLFDLLTSNRSTAGVRPKCVCTCNPVGRSNKLRLLLDWWIDPETDTAIPERDGKVRYFYRWGSDVSEMCWGDTPEEVYANQTAHKKIEKLCESTGAKYTDFITSMTFITGAYNDNKILQVSDPKYMSRVSASGGETTSNDIEGVWRDVDTGSCLVSAEDMRAMFDNTERRDGFMRASADVALTGDFFVIYAFDGHHVCDMDAWRGMPTDSVSAFIRNFLRKNGVREENFTYDSNGLGLWLKDAFPSAVPFNNKSTSTDNKLWNNLKSESAEKFVKSLKAQEFSIEPSILKRTFTDKKKHTFTVEDRLLSERLALKRKETDNGRFEIISKPQMKVECGESPDFIEALFMVMPLMTQKAKTIQRKGFENW